MPFTPFTKGKKVVEKKRKGGPVPPFVAKKSDEKSGKKSAKPGDFFAKMRSSK